MADEHSSIRQDTSGVLVVSIGGHLDEPRGESIREELVRFFGGSKRVEHALIDLSALTGCELLGRAQLREIHAFLTSRVGRIAYLAIRPRFRGLTHIVIHGAGSENAASFVTRKQADEWFAADRGRSAIHSSKIELELP